MSTFCIIYNFSSTTLSKPHALKKLENLSNRLHCRYTKTFSTLNQEKSLFKCIFRSLFFHEWWSLGISGCVMDMLGRAQSWVQYTALSPVALSTVASSATTTLLCGCSWPLAATATLAPIAKGEPITVTEDLCSTN